MVPDNLRVIQLEHALVELRASYNVLLTERIDVYVRDAIDAIAIEAPEFAVMKLRAVRDMIDNVKLK